MPKKRVRLSGWGNYPIVTTELIRPERNSAVFSFLKESNTPFIPRGAGKSYGDAALNKKNVLTTERLNHFIAFDKDQGILRCQAGVILHDILQVITPFGWFLPVLPGTQWVSVGGSFACNVHGKNHMAQGGFAEHVRSILLVLPNGEAITCTPVLNKELFWATAGGMGMTGLILELELQLVRVPSPFLNVNRQRVDSLQTLSDIFRKNVSIPPSLTLPHKGGGDKKALTKNWEDKSEYWVAWIDHFGQGPNLGRGIVETASYFDSPLPNPPPQGGRGQEHAPPQGSPPQGSPPQGSPPQGSPPQGRGDNLNPKLKVGFNIPQHWPKGLLNDWSMRFYNYLRLKAKQAGTRGQKTAHPTIWGGHEEIIHWQDFFNPLDHIHNWNRLYGKPGFLQYQCIIPESPAMLDHLAELLSLAQKKGIFSYLVVVKAHRDSPEYMSFPMRGLSIAMDFPYHARLFDLLNAFDAQVIEWGGRVYLAKDARLSPNTFEAMYAHALPAWRAVLKEIDPHKRMESEMSKRLGFHK